MTLARQLSAHSRNTPCYKAVHSLGNASRIALDFLASHILFGTINALEEIWREIGYNCYNTDKTWQSDTIVVVFTVRERH